MKKKRFQWLSNLRKFVTNNLCWWIRKKNDRKQEIEDIEIEFHPEATLFSEQNSTLLNPHPSIQRSAVSHLEVQEPLCKDIFRLEDDNSLLILLTEGNVRQVPFPLVRRETPPVIPLPWIKKLSDIREGNRIEIQIGLPITVRYEDLERSWITSRIFECVLGSYPSLLTKMQVVPYVSKRSPFYLHLISGDLYCQYATLTRPRTLESTNHDQKRDMESRDSVIHLKDAKSGQTIADIPPVYTIIGQPNSDNRMSELPSTGIMQVNWSGIDIDIREMHLTSLLVEDGDFKKLYKGYYGDINFVASDYRRVPKKLDMNDLAKLRSPNLAELFGIFQYNSHRWISYVEAKYGDLHTLLKQDPQRTVFGEDIVKFVIVRLLSALAYLHTRGVVHGDIRPSKIFINNLGMPLLGGLETVTWPSNKTLIRRSPKSMKIGFVAPEVMVGFRPQPASDIFSVGCVAYFMITGRRPFSKHSELLNKTKGPELLDIKLSPAGIEFFSACLQKPIGRRFHLGIGLRYVRQKEWFADMDIYEDFPRSPLIKAIELLNNDDTFAHDEKDKGPHVM